MNARRYLAVAGAVMLLSLLGDLRATNHVGEGPASAAFPANALDGSRRPVARGAEAGPYGPVAGRPRRTSTREDDGRATADDDAADDAGRVVPAVYTPNPEVRFVYFGRTSKWM